MSTSHRPSNSTSGPNAQPPQQPPKKTYYESQRELLILDIAQALNTTLHNLNALNRSLEEVIQVGNEFAPVESLWSHFEGVMGEREQAPPQAGEKGERQGEGVDEE